LFKRFAKSRRGVSPVIASVILVGAAIATGLVVVSWANNNFINQQTEAGVFFAGRSASMEESFVIEDVWFYGNGDYVNVTVRNVGAANMTIEAVYFNGTDRLDESQSVVVGTDETLTITWTSGWEDGSYYIVVASARGNQVREYYSTLG